MPIGHEHCGAFEDSDALGQGKPAVAVSEQSVRGVQSAGPGFDRLAVVKGQGGRRPRAALKELSRHRGPRVVIYVASGPEKGIRERLARAAGRGGSWLFIRADLPAAAKWVEGLS